MNMTPFLSRLISSAVNHGYFVFINGGIIRIKISESEKLFIKQYFNGDISCYVSCRGVKKSLPKDSLFDYMFSSDEYGVRHFDSFGYANFFGGLK